MRWFLPVLMFFAVVPAMGQQSPLSAAVADCLAEAGQGRQVFPAKELEEKGRSYLFAMCAGRPADALFDAMQLVAGQKFDTAGALVRHSESVSCRKQAGLATICSFSINAAKPFVDGL